MGVKKEAKKGVDFVKWFSELNKDSGAVAGGKGANLGEIYNLKVSVPPGFVVTAQAYDYFIKKAELDDKIKEILGKIDYEDTKDLDDSTKQIRELIINSKFPKEMETEVLDSYEDLDTSKIEVGKGLAHDILRHSSEPIFVAVRSSATTEDLAEASFAGQQDSFLNVKGKDDLIEHIKKCFASLFTSRATYYRNKKGFEHTKASLAVVVQKMVDSDKSGVIFSKDPFHKKDNVIIEAVWGLGEGIVSGKITPDNYVIASDLKLLKKEIADKKIAITRNSSGDEEIIKLKPTRSKQQVLTEFELKKLAEIAINLEDHYGKPQDIEFAIEGEEIYIVQTRPVTTIGSRIDEGKDLKGEVILTGLAASPGIGVGKIKIVETMADLPKVQKGDILVTKMTNPDMVVTMQKSAAIVTDEGGMTAHAAIVSREMGIPCVVGTKEATTKLKDGEIITVHGSTGKVYKGKVAETTQKEVLPVTVETKTKIKVIVDLPSFAKRASLTKLNQVGLTRMEGIIAESGKHPNFFLKKGDIKDYEDIIFKGIKQISNYFGEIWVRTSDIRSDEYANLEGAPKEKEANPMLGMHGIRYSVKHPEILKAELNALKRVSDKGTIIGLLLPQVILVEEVQKVKEVLKEIGFTKKVKVGVMVETPAAVQIIKDLCEEGIDFISFGTNDLTQYMLAIDRGNEQVQHLYNEMHPAILYQLGYVIRICKKYNVESSICGQSGSRKDMAKFLVEKGIDSISVNADMAKEISEYVAEIENSLVAGTDKEPRQYQPEAKEKEKQKEEENGFVKPQRIIPEENVIENMKHQVEEGLERVEHAVEQTFHDKKGEAPIIPGAKEEENVEEKKQGEETGREEAEKIEKEQPGEKKVLEPPTPDQEKYEPELEEVGDAPKPEETAPEIKEEPKVEEKKEEPVLELPKLAPKEEEKPKVEDQFDHEPEFTKKPKEEEDVKEEPEEVKVEEKEEEKLEEEKSDEKESVKEEFDTEPEKHENIEDEEEPEESKEEKVKEEDSVDEEKKEEVEEEKLETKEEIITDIEESGVPEEIAKEEEKIDEEIAEKEEREAEELEAKQDQIADDISEKYDKGTEGGFSDVESESSAEPMPEQETLPDLPLTNTEKPKLETDKNITDSSDDLINEEEKQDKVVIEQEPLEEASQKSDEEKKEDSSDDSQEVLDIF
ncbi:MAG: phosphoenolpyruvate synthase [archaeon]